MEDVAGDDEDEASRANVAVEIQPVLPAGEWRSSQY
jgi:hypothetical protein